MRISRRQWIKDMGRAGAGWMLLPVAERVITKGPARITLLHTNDVRSHLDPFPADGSRNAGLGGVAARSALIRQVRNEAEHVLLFDAGDMMGGTAYFDLFRGAPEIKAMNWMGYDAVILGESDFSGGIESLAEQLAQASFSVIAGNYDFSGTAMEQRCVPYRIFEKAGIRVGVIGTGIALKGLIPAERYGGMQCLDAIEQANRQARLLKQKGCELIVCLSHLGDRYSDNRVSDEILAKSCYDIDIIFGGHTRKFFSSPRSYRNRNGGDTIVNQAGWGGLQLGRIDYIFEPGKKKNLFQAHTVVIGEKTRE